MVGRPAKVTMADIAQAAGVSMATASRALSDHPKVAPATRERVQGVAADLGYVHNTVAYTGTHDNDTTA